MKQLLILPIHSSADIITNSSSELFVCNTQKTEQDIREMLGLLAQVTGDHGVGNIRVLQGVDGFTQVLNDLDDYLDQYSVNELLSKFIGDNVVDKAGGYPKFNYIRDYNKPKDMDWEVYYRIQVTKLQFAIEEIVNWIKDNNLENHFGTITLIESESDNSIPYELFDILESQLNGVRYHLG